jgi:hypothetical protein
MRRRHRQWHDVASVDVVIRLFSQKMERHQAYTHATLPLHAQAFGAHFCP